MPRVPDQNPPAASPPPASPAPPHLPEGESTLDTLKRTTTKTMREALAPGGWARRFAKLWGFLIFCIGVLVFARHVILPFIFALLLAFILAPAVRWLSTRADGGRRMPIAAAIGFCYVVLLGMIALFIGALIPRLSHDVATIGREAPRLYAQFNDTWAPQIATWLESRLPSLATPQPVVEAPPSALPVPPGTQLLVQPLADGRFAIQLDPSGFELHQNPDGTIRVKPGRMVNKETRVADRLRGMARDALLGIQQQVGSVVRLGQAVIGAVARGIFTGVLILMIAAFVLLDIDRITSFVRGLVPLGYRSDYDVVAAGISRGLNGVIRGQLLICGVNGVLTWVGLVLFDVRYQLLLASVACIMSLIPIFGSILSTIPIVVTAVVSGSEGLDLARGVFITVWIIGIHMLEANYLNPRIIGSAAKIHPVLVIFALVLGEHTYGLTGALLAVPVAAVVQFLFVFFRSRAWRSEGSPATI